MDGWIKLNRALLESSAFCNSLYLKVFIWCLLKASSTDKAVKVGFNDIHLKPGEFITSQRHAAAELSISESCFRRIVKALEADNRIMHKATNRYTHITLVNWGLYQIESEKATSKRRTSDAQPTSKRRTSDDNQEYKEYKEIKEKENSPFGAGGFG